MRKTPARGKADGHVWAARRPLRHFQIQIRQEEQRGREPATRAQQPPIRRFSMRILPPARCRPPALVSCCRSRLTSSPARDDCSPGTERANARAPALLLLFPAGRHSFS